MKQAFAIFVLLVTAGLLFASGGPKEAAKQEPVTIRLLTYWNKADPYTPYYEEVAAQMEKDFPYLTLNNEGYESAAARDKYAVEFASGSPPDLTFVTENVAREYTKQGLLLDLYPFVTADPEWKDYYTTGTWNAYAGSGKMFYSPMLTNYGSMMYNKRVLAKAGLAAKPAEEWKELMSYIGKIRSAGIDPWLTGGKEFRWAWLVAQMMERTSGVDTMREMAIGSKITDWDVPENGFIQAMELLDQAAKAKAFPADVNSLPRQVGYGIFAKDGGAMWYEGSWMIGSFTQASGDDNFDDDVMMMGPFPKVAGAKGDQEAGVSGPIGLVISSKISDEKQRLALELLKRLCSSKLLTRFFVENSHPTVMKLIDPDWSKVSPRLREQMELYGKLDKVIPPNDVLFAPAVDNAIKKVAAPAVVAGTMTPLQAAEEVKRRAEAYFKK